jgi:hypothetical protein
MYHDFTFSDVLAGSAEAARQAEDVLAAGAQPGLDRRVLPEALARAGLSKAR